MAPDMRLRSNVREHCEKPYETRIFYERQLSLINPIKQRDALIIDKATGVEDGKSTCCGKIRKKQGKQK